MIQPVPNPELFGLPPDFGAVRYGLSDEAKNAVRERLQANEPVVISLANEGDTVTLVGTPLRLFVVKTGTLGAGASGVAVREFPWEGLEKIIMTPVTHNVKFALHYRSSNNGKTVELGRRAALAKSFVENLMPFEKTAAEEVYDAMIQLQEHRRQSGEALV